MPNRYLVLIAIAVTTCAGQNGARRSPAPAQWRDSSPHSTQFISVDLGVRLEVLDWGGSGQAVVLLAGLGNTAHVFDDFGPKLIPACHVYAITRRGFGASSSPATGYSADRLGDDVLAVIDSLKLDRPVLVGHSIGGQELSSVAVRHPEKVAGLIYLDAGYGYAYYDPSIGDVNIDSLYLRKAVDQLPPATTSFNRNRQTLKKLLTQAHNADTPREEMLSLQKVLQINLPVLEKDLRGLPEQTPLVRELLQTALPLFRRELERRCKDLRTAQPPPKEPSPRAPDLRSFPALRSWLLRVNGGAPPEAELRQQFGARSNGSVGKERDISKAAEAVEAGAQRYTNIRCPALAIYCIPHRHDTTDAASEESQARAFEVGVPSARVIRMPNEDHFVFLSNEPAVLREIQMFLNALPTHAN